MGARVARLRPTGVPSFMRVVSQVLSSVADLQAMGLLLQVGGLDC